MNGTATACVSNVIAFPPMGPFHVHIERQDAGGWLVICRQHGWLYGSFRQAFRSAKKIARGFGVAVKVRDS